MLKHLISLAAWSYLPNFITGLVQSTYYQLTIRVGEAKPAPHSLQYRIHRRRIHTLVLSAYFIFSIYEADWEIQRQPTFNALLGVGPTPSNQEIKSRFRRLVTLHHPDKVGAHTPGAEAYFVQLRLANDVLLHPVKRFAYERFGADILACTRCSSRRDFIIEGLESIIPHYVGTIVIMYLMGFLGYIKSGMHWRWLVLASTATFEIYTITRPYYPPFLSNFLNPILMTLTLHPPYLPFQLIQLAHKISLTIYIALSQFGLIFQSTQTTDFETKISRNLNSAQEKVRAIDIETNRLLNLEISPFIDKDTHLVLHSKMKEWLIQNTIKMDPAVQEAMKNCNRSCKDKVALDVQNTPKNHSSLYSEEQVQQSDPLS
ncbi:unnamed protein product [Blumeria hordei]|uniref:J domain-containing protein n=1 Tax=Blumeria hordei TaxID=2867405 RepID=A0A383UTZ4_BLUHO|nr:unnamed protein product [Blumeria hordei]